MELYEVLGIVAILMLTCLFSSKISGVLNMPCLLLFLGVGMLAGSDGIGGFYFSNAFQANTIGMVAMAFILFSGGYDTAWKKTRRVFKTGLILASIGVLLTALITGTCVWGLITWLAPQWNVSFSWCLLLGSIISSTDAAAVFSILRSRGVSLRGRLQGLLEFESGSNDPMATFLTLFMINIVVQQASGGLIGVGDYLLIIPAFLWKMFWGVLIGALVGWGMVHLFKQINFDYDGLYYVLGIVVVLFSFSLAELFRGNGFMAVYVSGMVMGNSRFIYHNSLGRFYDGVAWIMQVTLFTMLGLLVFPSRLFDTWILGIIVAFCLMFFSRPLAILGGMLGSNFTFKERLLVSWVGLRGGAPIMLATFPLMQNVKEADFMFHLVFFIVLASIIVQGMTIMPVARLFHLDAPMRKSARSPVSLEETGDTTTLSGEITIGERCHQMKVSELDLPKGLLVLMIRREDRILVPRGETLLQSGDILSVLGDHEGIQEMTEKYSEEGED